MNLFKAHGLRILIGAILSIPFLLQTAGITDWRFIKTLEYFAYDTQLKFSLPNTIDKRIVIVDIDEKSLAAEGRWPWPRNRLALLVDRLFNDYRVSSVGFDMVFAEEEHKEISKLEDNLRGSGKIALANELAVLSATGDDQFAQSLANRQVVLGYYLSNKPNVTGKLPEPYLPSIIANELNIPAPIAQGYGANLEIFQNAAKRGGFFDNPLSDDDGVFRRAPMLQSYQGDIYESLSLTLAQIYLDQPLSVDADNEWLHIGSHTIPVDGEIAALVPYRGKQGSFPYISATDVLQQTVANPDVLKGVIVLVGTTAPGLYDLRSTPVEKVYAGVEVHANLISGILDNRFLAHPDYMLAVELLILVLFAIALIVVFPLLGAVTSTLLVIAMLLVVTITDIYLWNRMSLNLSVVPTILLVFSLYLFNMIFGFIAESRDRKALTRRFGQYVPPELVKEMSANPQQYSMTGERRDMTVLFSDVRGFSNLAENMDPGQLSELMNDLLTALTRVIHEHRGTIDKYMGDAVMAFWGAPLDDEHHASGAVSAALGMVAAINQARVRFHEKGWPQIRMGLGVNTGPMNVGDMGSEFRMAYTVMGDAVNVGARLEGLTRIYGVDIIVSEDTVKAAPDFVYRELDRVRVKGRDAPLSVYEPVVSQVEVTTQIQQEIAAYETCLRMYRQHDWSDAYDNFAEVAANYGQNPIYALYMQRIEYFFKRPPPDQWDGVFDFDTEDNQS